MFLVVILVLAVVAAVVAVAVVAVVAVVLEAAPGLVVEHHPGDFDVDGLQGVLVLDVVGAVEGLAALYAIGVVVLLAALVVVMTNVERAFNATWRVSQTRSFRRKLSD